MGVIAGFFGPCPLDVLPSQISVFSYYFKRLAQFAKLATSSMKDRAMRLKEVTLASGTMARSPRAPVGMTIRAQIASPPPASIRTVTMGTEGP
jgi:hypothetical protein